MRVYFTASLTGKAQYSENYHAIVSALKHLGHEVIADHIFSTTAKETRSDPLNKRLEYLRYLNDGLAKCDLLIAETSYPSTSVGFEVCWALNRGKSVVVLYTENVGFPPVLAGVDNEKLIIEVYSKSNLFKVIGGALTMVEKTKDQRFTMLLPADIMQHLDTLSDGGTTRSEYIRKLIKKDMDKSK